MIYSLRKRHRTIWYILAILLPILFALAIWLVPNQLYQDKLYQKPVDKTERPF